VALASLSLSQRDVSLDLQLVSKPPASRAEQALHDAPLRETIDTVLHLGLRYFGLEVATFSEVSGDSLVVHSQKSDAEVGRVVGPPGLAGKGVIAIHDASDGGDEASRRLRALGQAAYIGAPLVFAGKTLGLLELCAREARFPYVQSDLDMIASLAHWLESELGQAVAERRDSLRAVAKLDVDTRSSGRYVLSAVNDILEIERIDAGKVELAPSRCAVGAPAHAALDAIAAQAARKNVRLFSAIDSSAGEVSVDRERFTHVVTTLLSIAVRNSRPLGHVGIDVVADDKTQTISYSVWDDGPALDATDYAAMLSPVADVDALASQPDAGLGVGLSLVYRIADLHHGSLTVAAPRFGNRFTITIPSQRTLPPATVRSAWQNLLVLLSDPRGSLAAAVEPWLRSRGHRVLSASGHDEALEQAQMFRPEVMLMDVTADCPNGIAALRRLRAARDIALATLPVVATSALALPGDAAKLEAAGATAYLRRPLPMRSVIALVERNATFAKAC
jgi:signal transduction histidine kinase/ActR/RegA family two-component response regulator